MNTVKTINTMDTAQNLGIDFLLLQVMPRAMPNINLYHVTMKKQHTIISLSFNLIFQKCITQVYFKNI